MAEKLSESSWTGFKNKQKLDLNDALLVKALAVFDKTKESEPEPRLKALEELVKQIPEQVKALTKRKKELGDKPFGEAKDKLYGLLDAAESLQKDTRLTVDKAQRDAKATEKKGGPSEEDDEESPALLTTKMIPLIREVRRGELVLQSLIALAGKETVVLLSRKAISPARGKLLKEQMTKPSGLKFIRGECLFEENALTFVVQSGAAGLAKKIKAALLTQTDLRLKVRVRGENPDDVDEDLEDEETKTGTATKATAASDMSRLVEAMTKLSPGIEDVAAARPNLKADLLRRVSGFHEHIKAGDAAQARETLLELAALVKRVKGELAELAAMSGTSDFSKVAFERIHLDWDARKKTVEDRLSQLHQAIVDAWDDPQAVTAAANLRKVLARFNEGLGDTLDALRNATAAADRATKVAKARAIAERYLAYLSTDPLVAHVENNPFEISVDVGKNLTVPLNELKGQLAKLDA
jgi:hypothetical protein